MIMAIYPAHATHHDGFLVNPFVPRTPTSFIFHFLALRIVVAAAYAHYQLLAGASLKRPIFVIRLLILLTMPSMICLETIVRYMSLTGLRYLRGSIYWRFVSSGRSRS